MPVRDFTLLSFDRVLRQRTATDWLQHSQVCFREPRAGQDAPQVSKRKCITEW